MQMSAHRLKIPGGKQEGGTGLRGAQADRRAGIQDHEIDDKVPPGAAQGTAERARGVRPRDGKPLFILQGRLKGPGEAWCSCASISIECIGLAALPVSTIDDRYLY